MKYIFLFTFIPGFAFPVFGQSTPAIEFSKLQSCEILVKMDSATQIPSTNFIDSIKNTEVVWFIVGERNYVTLAKAQRVGYFQTEVKNGKTVIFIMPKNRVTRSRGKISGVYPNWNLCTGLKFYKADCFYDLIKKL